jgi:uncharacterized protein YjbI with pentapeptide repeats
MSAPSQRWKGEAGAALASEVIKRLKAGRALDGLGLGNSKKGVDLSGLPAAPSRGSVDRRVGSLVVQQVSGVVEINGQRLAGIDFSAARLNGWRLRKCELVDCQFVNAQCAEWILWDCTVSRCSFDQTNLRGALLGAEPGQTRWDSTSFVGSDFRHASAYGAAFVDCDFSDARLDQAHFNQCLLSHCRFAGRIEDAVFDGRKLPGRPAPSEMEAVDFSRATFVNTDFRGFSLGDVALPTGGEVFVIHRFPCVGSKVLEETFGDESESARILRAVLQNSLGGPPLAPDSSLVFNRRDWREWGGEELARLAEASMRAAETDCAP